LFPVQRFSEQSLAAHARAAQKQGYVTHRLKPSLQKLYGHHNDLVDRYEIAIFQMTMGFFLIT